MTRWLIGSVAALALSVDGCNAGDGAVLTLGAAALLMTVALLGFLWRAQREWDVQRQDLPPTKRTATTMPPPRMRDDLMQRSENLLALSNQLKREAYELRDIALKTEEP